jgi:D-alanyl-D-alanine carboxypeptidase
MAAAANTWAADLNIPTLQAAIQHYVDECPARSGAPGVTAAVALPSGEVLQFAAGLSDVENGFAMQPDDRMAAGSIGKSFVGAYAAALVTEGVVKLDDPIEKYLGREPWFNEIPYGKDITLKMLLNHTAGMSEWYPNLPKDMTRAQLLELLDPRRPRIEVLRYSFKKPPSFRPGTRYEYSDSNFLLAALVLEAATGRDYNEEITRRFLYPLRLRHTAPSLSTTEAGFAQGYVPADAPFWPLLGIGGAGKRGRFMEEPGVQPVNPRFEGAGGGFTTTAHDLALWSKLLYENRAFRGDYLGIALGAIGPQNEETRQIGPVALGMFVWDPAQGYKRASTISGKQYGHLGTYLGYSAAVMYFPHSKISVAMMFNTMSPREALHQLPTDIADIVVAALNPPAPR